MLKYSCTILQYISHVQQKINILLYMIKKIKLISSHVRSKKSPLSLKEITYLISIMRYLYWLIRKKYTIFFFHSPSSSSCPTPGSMLRQSRLGFFPPSVALFLIIVISIAFVVQVLQFYNSSHTHTRTHLGLPSQSWCDFWRFK